MGSMHTQILIWEHYCTVSPKHTVQSLSLLNTHSPITDRKELLKHAKALVEATKLLMHALKSQADKDDHDSRRRLLNAIKELASATSKMAQLAKGVATTQDRAAIGK